MLLALDTCGVAGGVALGPCRPTEQDDWAAICFFHRLAGGQYSELLLDTVSAVLSEAGAQLSRLKAIVVVSGPGSFTGIRIGVSAAKSLAEALGIPIIALSRLRLLAGQHEQAIPVLDAGRGEYYVRLPGMEEVLLTLDELFALQRESCHPLIVCEEHLTTSLAGAILVEAPTAVDALAAGARAFQVGSFADVETLEANYVRRTGEEMLARIAKHAELRAIAQGLDEAK